ncbi:MAG: LCP family protein [Actinomycetota bacterium]|nr:LCP family protein [Actinomycetota bacterium]
MKPSLTPRRLVAGAIVAAVGIVAIVFGLSLGKGGDVAAPTPSVTSAAPLAPKLLSISVRSLPQPLVAVVGVSSDGRTAAINIPPSLLVTIPGGGDGTIGEVALRPGETLAATISNMLGTWIDAHATTDMVGLIAIVDRAGGLTLPGSSRPSTGDQVRAYLEQKTGSERLARWSQVLSALLAKSLVLQDSDLRGVGELQPAQGVLSQVSSAQVEDLPATPTQGRFLVADQAGITKLLASALGIKAAPVARVAVLNGNGRPGVGESVASVLIPAGYRVVSSQNAQKFGQKTTRIVAQGEPVRAAAERLRALLGVGRVIVVDQRSGFADITLVVGEDYKAT